MRRILLSLAAGVALGLAVPGYADDKPADAPAAASATAAPDAGAPAAAPAPPPPSEPFTVELSKINSGDTAWMLSSTALVLLMTIPGLALFYGGMVRKKNVLATIMQNLRLPGDDSMDGRGTA
jgi:Amt family ammonium transporter